MGPWVPFLAAFLRGSLGPVPGCFPFFTFIWGVFQTFCSLVASDKASAHPLPDSFCLPCTRRGLRVHCCEPSVLTPTAFFDELFLVTVLMTPRATSYQPWHRRHDFPAALHASPPASLHVTLAASPASITCCASARSSTCFRTQALEWSVHHSHRSCCLPVPQHDSPS